MKSISVLVLVLTSSGCSSQFTELLLGEEAQKSVWGTGSADLWSYTLESTDQSSGIATTHFTYWNGSSAQRVELPVSVKERVPAGLVTAMASVKKGETWLAASEGKPGMQQGKHLVLVTLSSGGSVVDHTDLFPALTPGDSDDVYGPPNLMARGGLLLITVYVPKTGPKLLLFDGTSATVIPPPGGLVGQVTPEALISANDLYVQAYAGGAATRLTHWDGTSWTDLPELAGQPRVFSVASASDVWLWNDNLPLDPLDTYSVFRRDGTAFTEVVAHVGHGKSDGNAIQWLPVALAARTGGKFALVGSLTIPVDGTVANHAMASRTFDGKELSASDNRLTAEDACITERGSIGNCPASLGRGTELEDGTLALRSGRSSGDVGGGVRTFLISRDRL